MSLGKQKHLSSKTTSNLTKSVARKSLWKLLQKKAHDEGFKED